MKKTTPSFIHEFLLKTTPKDMASLLGNDPSLDGSKKTAIAAAGVFPRRDDCRLEASQKSMEKFTLDFAIQKVILNDAMQWMKEHSIEVKERRW
ncbi:MAG TPA: hypothetical protein VL122_08375 [Nitrospirota bacterium]|nr:hypothetical protein [Nitrospirota bacterium]